MLSCTAGITTAAGDRPAGARRQRPPRGSLDGGMTGSRRKALGAYYTPPAVAAALVGWAVRRPEDRLLDPACGDGRFLALHPRSTGVDRDETAARAAAEAAPGSVVHRAEFFEWALSTRERFECAAGNPPFIRYQRFAGAERERAQRLAASVGAEISGLASSWAPYLVAAASRLRHGGRMAFVVPAEIGHAPYAAPVLSWFADRFEVVRVTAIREKLFPELSEDAWLLFADGFGGRTESFELSVADRFDARSPLPAATGVSLRDWRRFHCRLRPFLLPDRVRAAYRRLSDLESTRRLGDFARVGVGYVTGDNDFFHLRPTRARDLGIPDSCLTPTVRRGRDLNNGPITEGTVSEWRRRDAPNFLLRLGPGPPDSSGVLLHLDSAAGRQARRRYKCRVRNPWYSVPNVTAPDLFLPTMSQRTPALVENRAGCACANAVHAVRLRNSASPAELRRRWDTPLTALSCEIEGHPLGGGVLKLEPREAARIAIAESSPDAETTRLLREGRDIMGAWRHRAQGR